MSNPFDPYHQWLGIPPKKQPPNHYTLLGLDAFESNPDVIDNAADQRMAHLRTLQSGQRGELSQQLLNEVSAARLCLLDQDRKTDYDLQLRGEVKAEDGQQRVTLDVSTRAPNVPALTPASMLFDHREFRLPKDVRRPEDYEDACAVNPLISVAALAGGVSSIPDSGTWARLLVDAAVKHPPRTDHGDWFAWPRQAWSDRIAADSLASHRQPNVQESAAATLLIVQLSPTPRDGAELAEPVRLAAYAAGDCCLFHVRGDQVLHAFPYEESRLFQQDPRVIHSVDHTQQPEVPFDTFEDYCRPDDLIVLCTGAIAAWTLRQLEAGYSPNWENCWYLSQREWSEHIERLREQRLIQFDDTTVLLLKVAQHKQSSVSEERNLHADWRDDVRQAFDDLTRQGKRALQDLKHQSEKVIDWFKSG